MIAVDHIGCGLSDKPAHYPYILSQHIDNLRQLIQSLDLQQVTLLAHDWGGAIGLGAAVAEPERFSRLALFNTGAFRAPHMPWRIRICRTSMLGPLAVRGLNAFARAALWMATERPGGLPKPVQAGLLAPYSSWANRIAIQRFVEDIPMRPGDRSYGDLLAVEQGLRGLPIAPCCWLGACGTGVSRLTFWSGSSNSFRRRKFAGWKRRGTTSLKMLPDEVLAAVQGFLARHPLETVPR